MTESAPIITKQFDGYTYELCSILPDSIDRNKWFWFFNISNDEIHLRKDKESEDCLYVLSTDDPEVIGAFLSEDRITKINAQKKSTEKGVVGLKKVV